MPPLRETVAFRDRWIVPAIASIDGRFVARLAARWRQGFTVILPLVTGQVRASASGHGRPAQ